MSKIERLESVREKVAEVLYDIVRREMEQFIDEYEVSVRKPRYWEDLDDIARNYWFMKANRILSLVLDER